jgi:hypothetical protein
MTTAFKNSETTWDQTWEPMGRRRNWDKTKDIENLINEITAENFPNLGENMDIQEEEAFRTTSRHDQRRIYPHHFIGKMPRI